MDVWFKRWSLILVVVTNIHFTIAYGSGSGMAPFPSGKRQTCPNEGEPVTTGFDAQIVHCFPCICKNGYVECKNDCPRINECHLVVDGGCCKICKGCTYNGMPYPSHTEWLDPSNPCKIIRCEAGIITISDLQCHTSCSNPIPPEPGKCCSTCPVCKMSGQVVAEDRDVISENDPCLKCRCSKGQLTCTKKACPVLQCIERMQYKASGECCPRCNGTRTIIIPKDRCPVGRDIYREEEQYGLDKCTSCKCVNSTSVCTRRTCPVLDCALENQKIRPGLCCPTCIKSLVDEAITQCHYNGRPYEDGDTWPMDACSSCNCNSGIVSCARTTCNRCPAGMKTIQIPGECCKRCVENEGACMAFGDPHYKTFDGKIYTFKGVGKYQFIEDCENGTFSIKVANELTNKYMDSTITKRVAITFGDVRLNLQQRLRVKYNGQKIPVTYKKEYKKEGKFRVTNERDFIEVRLQNDVVIVWNGRSFLEVTVPPTYKGKLCGLCGNFNGDVQDDLRTKNGRVLNEQSLTEFGASWCVGKKSECAKKVKPTRKPHRETQYCQYLNEDIFSACEPKLSNSKYYKACKMDMYNCLHGKCYCESLMAYARECQRLGVKFSNWQKYSKCDSHHHSHRTNPHFSKLNKGHHKQHASSQSTSSEEFVKYADLTLSRTRTTLIQNSRTPIPIQ
ncbi:BMP-binding endothelial regulator protein isoform X2 [Euwallacea fornicatus]